MLRVLLTGLLVSVVACGAPGMDTGAPPGPTTTVTKDPTVGPEVSVDEDGRWRTTLVRTARGGRCPDGACLVSVRVEEDGTWQVTTGGGRSVEATAGRVEPSAVDEVEALLLQRWNELTAEPFAGECPTVYDGQKQILELRRIPTGGDAHRRDADIRRTSSCEDAWPDELLRELDDRWEEAGLPAV